MFVCDQEVTYFDVEGTLGMRLVQIWNKARQIPPFMIIAEAKKLNKTTV